MIGCIGKMQIMIGRMYEKWKKGTHKVQLSKTNCDHIKITYHTPVADPGFPVGGACTR